MLLVLLYLKLLGLRDGDVVGVVLGLLPLILGLLWLCLLLLHAVEEVELPVRLLRLCHPGSSSDPVVLILDVLLGDVLGILDGLAGRVDGEVVAGGKVLEAVFNQWEVVYAEEAVTLEQLCLLLVLGHKIRRVVVLGVDARLHEAAHLVPVAFVLHHEVVRIAEVRDQCHVMVTDHVRLRLDDCLVLVVVAVRVLQAGIKAHGILRRGGERLAMVVHRQLTDKLRTLLAHVLQVVLVPL